MAEWLRKLCRSLIFLWSTKFIINISTGHKQTYQRDTGWYKSRLDHRIKIRGIQGTSFGVTINSQYRKLSCNEVWFIMINVVSPSLITGLFYNKYILREIECWSIYVIHHLFTYWYREVLRYQWLYTSYSNDWSQQVLSCMAVVAVDHMTWPVQTTFSGRRENGKYLDSRDVSS